MQKTPAQGRPRGASSLAPRPLIAGVSLGVAVIVAMSLGVAVIAAVSLGVAVVSGALGLAGVSGLPPGVAVMTRAATPVAHAQSGSPESSPQPVPQAAADSPPLGERDIARVHVVATIGQGTVFATTRSEVLENPMIRKVVWLEGPRDPAPLLVLAGEATALPGLGGAVLGMCAGERREVQIPPEEAFGPRDSALVRSLRRAQHVPREMTMGPREFCERFDRFPTVGDEFPLDDFIRAAIVRVTAQETELRLAPREPLQRETRLGLTEIRATDTEIIIVVTPRLGAAWHDREGRAGRVVAVGETAFRVDFNHPLAGKTITFDIEVLARVAPESLAGMPYPWRDDHDAALQDARRQGRPVFLLLCATWCSWTEELLVRTLEEPQIKIFRDRFVWVQIESDLYPEYRDRYRQTGSPMIVLIDRHGEIVYQKQGFREAPAVRAALLDCLRIE
ncbi:MAG: thioredoxin family protein [Candidatus Eisenbacteria sp.]|nr:thioredoxin family protein [Candidatus Eisenbacteria bacterium]